MKKVRAFFAIVILAMAVFIVAVLGAAKSFAESMHDGLMMPASSDAARALNAGDEAAAVALVPVSSEDVIYTSFGRFYVGEDRSSVDLQYPMWVSGGAGLRFMDDENWLISSDVEILRTYDGLYLTNGTTYNSDRTQADMEEFIFLRLQNGLYMNAQSGQFITKMQTYDIPANSILLLSETALRWYSLDGRALSFGRAEEVFDATLRVGEHEYDYAALLKALGLIDDAIRDKEDGKDTDETLEEAEELLQGGDAGGQNDNTNGSTGSGTGTGDETSTDPNADGAGAAGASGNPGDSGDPAVGEPAGSTEGDAEQGASGGQGDGSETDNKPGDGSGDSTGSENGDGTGEGGTTGDVSGEGSAGGNDGSGSDSGENEGEEEEGDGSGEPGEPGIPSEGEEGSSEEGEGSGGTGSGQPIPYRAPEVEILDIQTWTYAINMRLRLFDPAGTITKGVRITAFKELSPDKKDTGRVTEEGFRIFEANEGRSALLRKSYTSGQVLNLSPLSPDTTFYLQFTYTYIAEETDSQGVVQRVRRTYSSDFVEVPTQSIQAGGVAELAAEWTIPFAGHSNAIQLDGFTLCNTTDYDPADDSFDNFKKNTLPYINRIQLLCTPVDENGNPLPDSETVTISMNSTILSRAQQEGGTTFTSSSPSLLSNTRYQITARLQDRYSNELPLLVNGTDSTQPFYAYTAKKLPSVKIEETSNVTDKLTLTLRVSDPDGALAAENGQPLPLTLTALDTDGNAAVLSGTFKDGTAFGKDGESKTLTLEAPADGKSYTITIDSLAFARTYQFRVAGTYAPQPDNVSDPSLQVQPDVQMGSARIYTASLSSGLVNFTTSIANLLDTSVTVNASMISKTTLDILPLVDEYRVNVTKQGDQTPTLTCTLSMTQLDRPTADGIEDGSWYYDEAEGALVLQEGDALTPRILLVGSASLFEQYTPWQALSPKIVDPAAEKIEYTTPARLRVDVPALLDTSTRYNLQIQSVVIKGGEEYQIPTTLSTTSFTTKKIQPKLLYSDLFAAGDVLSLIDTRVFDPDGTIQQDGLVYVYLYYNGTLLDMQRIYADSRKDSPGETVQFDGIIEGAEYELKFVAAAFNDADGFSSYETNRLLWSYIVEGGSSLNGSIRLDNIEYTSANQARNEFVNLTGEEVRSRIGEDGSWTTYGTYSDVYTTEQFSLPEGITFLQITDCYLETEQTTGDKQQIVPTFYNGEGTVVKYENLSQDATLYYGGNIVYAVPAEAVSVSLRIPVTEEGLLRWGLTMEGYTTPQVNILETVSGQADSNIQVETGELISGSYLITEPIKVQPGEVYCFVNSDSRGAGRPIYLYTEDGGYIGYLNEYRNRPITVPENVGQIRFALPNITTNRLFRISDVAVQDGYTVESFLEVNDNNGYLSIGLEEGEPPVAMLQLYAGDTLSASDRTLREEYSLHLQDADGDNKYQLVPEDAAKVLSNLPANQSYELVLMATYQGTEVVLDSTTFQTDGAYFVIRNQRDLLRVNENPFANYLVVEDFEQNLTNIVSDLYGTIDFQGHVVTRKVSSYLISTIRAGGVVRNLVYDYPAGTNVTAGVVSTNSGTMENIIVRTQGQVNITNSGATLLINNNYTGGVLRNFILELNGDLYFSSSGYVGGLVRVNYGLIENGYMYGANGAGVMFMTLPGNQQRAGGLVGENYPSGQMRNIFTLFDSWYLGGTESYAGAVGYYNYYRCSNVYHVGDFYQYVSDKSTVSPMLKERVFNSSSTSSENQGVYYISANTYAATQTWVRATEAAVLYDEAWQQQVLGSGFDTGTLEVGFYPRLNLPTVMQKYQNYLPLPVLGDSAPEIIGDSWATGASEMIEDDAGNISLLLHNPRNCTISSLTVPGLKLIIQSQRPLGDGLYEVIAYAQVDSTSPQYLSSYTITEMQYTSGSSNVVCYPNYKTEGFEFWKTVSNAEEWADINNHMNWNYRLTADIDFKDAGLIPAAIVLNGSKTNISGTTGFSGKLDGDGHIISNITLEDIARPWVVYNLSSSTSVIQDLTVEKLVIRAGSTVAYSRAGFIGYMGGGELINVHVREAQISGMGYVGALVGHINNGKVQECSAADVTIDDGYGAYPARVGGLIGYMYGNVMDRCYVRNASIRVSSSAVVEGVGGLVGYVARAPITNCYATGSLEVKGGKAGGIVGVISESHASTNHIWADVSINASGSQVGGLAGWAAARHLGGIAFGNILTSSDEVNRINGAVSSNSYTGRNINAHAYMGQTVNNLQEDDISDARSLLSSEQLTSKAVWADTAGMGTSFDYTQLTLETPGIPLLLREDGTLVEGQTWIELPGQAEPPTLRITEASYESGAYPFKFSAELLHPGYRSEDIVALLKTASTAGSLQVDGINISEAEQEKGNVMITFDETNKDAEVTTFSVLLKEDADLSLFTKRLDAYTLTVAYKTADGREWSLDGTVDFGRVLYWDVDDLADWRNLMQNGHAQTGENFRISGKIDFANNAQNAKENGLKLGRLEGVGEDAGFYNLVYTADATTGTPWIESVYVNISGLTFDTMRVDFSNTTASRGVTGAIVSINTLQDCSFKNIELTGNANTDDRFGFFGQIDGLVQNISFNYVKLQVLNGSGGQYVGALAGVTLEGLQEVTAENITVDAPKAGYVGGLVGTQNSMVTPATSNVTMRNIIVTGKDYVGGLAHQIRQLQDTSIEGFSVTSEYYAGGLLSNLYTGDKTNITVKNGSVTATGTDIKATYVGGLASYDNGWGYAMKDIRVENVEVTGNNLVGGLLGRHGYIALDGIQVVNCKVSNPRTMPTAELAEPYYLSVGGIAGYHYGYNREIKNITVRGTEISGPCNVGGIVGTAYNTGTVTITNTYVAEDVTVTATGMNAGGIVGRGYLFQLENVACGAQVSATGNAAGGLVGCIEISNDMIDSILSLKNSYFAGTVYAGNYAGGLVGLIDHRTYQYEPEELSSVLMTGSVRSPGERSSLWMNSLSAYNSPGDGIVRIWEGACLNGQTALALQQGQSATNTDTFLLPKSGQIVPGESFAEASFYTGLGFSDEKWDLAALTDSINQYMPFIKDATGSRLPDSDEKLVSTETGESTVAAGILLPEIHQAESEVVVLYPTGADRVTLDVRGFDASVDAGATVSLAFGSGAATTFTTDKNGSLSFTTDFETPVTITVNNITKSYTAEQMQAMRRTVMTYDGFWYYVDADGALQYGNSQGTVGQIGGFADGSTPVHLWQGKVLCETASDGWEVYTLQTAENDGTVTAAAPEAVESGSKLKAAEPMYQYTYGGNGQNAQVRVFHEYSLYGSARVDIRLFELGGTPYVVAPQQDVVADGVLLSRKADITGNYSNYYALLQTDQVLADNRSNLRMGGLPSSGIAQISNNFGYTGNLAVIRYNTGDDSQNVAVVDYAQGKVLLDTRPQVTALLGYAQASLANLMHSFGSGAGNGFLESEAELGTGSDQAIPPEPLGGDGLGGDAQTESEEGEPVLGAGEASDVTGEASDVTGEPSGAAGEASGAAGEPSGAAGDGAHYEYRPGEGLYRNGELVPGSDEYIYVAGEGLYNGMGELVFAQSADAQNGTAVEMTPAGSMVDGTAQGGGSAAGGQTGTSDTDDAKALLEVLGTQVVVYSQKSGSYETVDTAQLLGLTDEKTGLEGLPTVETEETDPAGEETESSAEDFAVNHGLTGQQLTASERNGFMLLAVITGAALAVLAVLYIRYAEKKHKER